MEDPEATTGRICLAIDPLFDQVGEEPLAEIFGSISEGVLPEV